MTSLGRIIKNTSVLAVGQVTSLVISVFLTVSIARLGGREGLGVYSFVISILALFEILAGWGMRDYVIREVARHPDAWGRYFSTAVIIGLVSAFVLQGAFLLFSHGMGYEQAIGRAFFIVSFSLMPTVIQYFTSSTYYAFQRMEYVSAAVVGENLVRALVSIACLYFGFGLQSLFWVFVFSRTLTASILTSLLLRQMGRPPITWDREITRDVIKVAPTFALLAVVSALYWRLDILFLSKLGGSAEVGTYSAAYRLMYIFQMLASSLMTALFPLFSRSFSESANQFRLISGKALKYLLLVLFPIATATVFIAPRLIPLLYGEAFWVSVPVLQIIIWMIVPLGMADVFANALIASNQQKRDLQVNAIRLILGGAFNALLVPTFGSLGAAIAMVLSLSLGNVLQYGFLYKVISRGQLFGYIRKPLLASLLMAGIMTLLASANLTLALVLGSAVYVVVLLLQDTFNGEDRYFFETLRLRRTIEACQ